MLPLFPFPTVAAAEKYRNEVANSRGAPYVTTDSQYFDTFCVREVTEGHFAQVSMSECEAFQNHLMWIDSVIQAMRGEKRQY